MSVTWVEDGKNKPGICGRWVTVYFRQLWGEEVVAHVDAKRIRRVESLVDALNEKPKRRETGDSILDGWYTFREYYSPSGRWVRTEG